MCLKLEIANKSLKAFTLDMIILSKWVSKQTTNQMIK